MPKVDIETLKLLKNALNNIKDRIVDNEDQEMKLAMVNDLLDELQKRIRILQ